jgi:hypothetical protein
VFIGTLKPLSRRQKRTKCRRGREEKVLENSWQRKSS